MSSRMKCELDGVDASKWTNRIDDDLPDTPITPNTPFSPGLPVEIGKIDRELKKLWAESGGAMTRASLMNLAVYSEAPGSLPRNTEIIFKITEDHACRAIVIGANPGRERESGRGVDQRALPRQPRGRQSRFARNSFRSCWRGLPPDCCRTLSSPSSIPIFPFIFGGRVNFTIRWTRNLWAWVDRVIYDSQAWSDFRTQMERVETAQAEAKQRIVLCDLNWTRLVQFRLAIAQFFDHPAVASSLGGNRKRRDRFRARVSFDGGAAGGLARGAAALDPRGKLERQRAGFSRSGEKSRYRFR